MHQFKPKLKVAKISFLSPLHKKAETHFRVSAFFFLMWKDLNFIRDGYCRARDAEDSAKPPVYGLSG